MRNAKLLIPLLLVLLTTGCAPVDWLNPCFNDENLVLDPALVGTWNGQDGNSVLRFRVAGDKAYELVDTEIQADNTEPEQSKYEAHLVRLGPYLFLDLLPQAPQIRPGAYTLPLASSADGTPSQPHFVKVGDGLFANLVQGPEVSEAGQEPGSYEVRLSQAHWVFRVWVDGNKLRFTDLSEDWFKEAVDRGSVQIGFDRIDDTLVITASTEEIQAFLLEFGGDELAFPDKDETEYRRRE